MNKVYLRGAPMADERWPVDKSVMCDCGDVPAHTEGWCDAMVKAQR